MPLRSWLNGVTALTFLCGTLLPGLGHSQDAPPLAQAPAGDPPARVGRLASLRGQVAFRDQSVSDWTPATLNYPITLGSDVQVDGAGRAELEVDADRFTLPGPAELDVTQLNDSSFVATLPVGEVCFSLPRVPSGRSYSIQTPRGLVQIAAGGLYAVTAGDTATPTTVLVQAGAAQVSGQGLNLQIGPGQAASITGTDTPQGAVAPAPPDQCLADLAAELHPPARSAIVLPPAVADMTGAEDLASYGAWQATPDDGDVWFPRVDAGWVPYRHGHWAYVAPWGWTWCDDAPWGFAPFHYGRWVDRDGRWGWAPVARGGVYTGRPVYAPALVTFFGVGVAGLAAGALLSGSIGWVPLGPGEPYYPPYHVSQNYVRQINLSHVANVNTVVNNYVHNSYGTITINHYVNTAGATAVPAAAMVRSQPVAAQAVRIAPQQLATARPALAPQAGPAAQGAAETGAATAAFHLPPPPRPAGATPAAARPAVVPALRPRPETAGEPAAHAAPASLTPVPPAAPAGRPATAGAPAAFPRVAEPPAHEVAPVQRPVEVAPVQRPATASEPPVHRAEVPPPVAHPAAPPVREAAPAPPVREAAPAPRPAPAERPVAERPRPPEPAAREAPPRPVPQARVADRPEPHPAPAPEQKKRPEP